jgi:hypothetical protein
MARKDNSVGLANQGENEVAGKSEALLESIARSLSLLVKLAAKETQGDRKIAEMILLLHSMGFRPVEIAEALGKTANGVNPVLSRARKGGRKPKKAGRGRTKR